MYFIPKTSSEIENICGVNGNEMELIALIRNCPFLYNPSYPDFKVAEKRDQAWKAIAKVFSVSTNELQHHWKHMKESFKKYSCKGNLDPNIKSCVTYFDEMKFLVPFMNRGKSRISSKTVDHFREDGNTSASSELEISNTDYNLKLEVLIDAVSINPVLYDRKHKDAKNQDVKLKTWKKIALNLGIPVSDCINKWKNLREKYARERKYRRSNLYGKKWHLFDKLLFLEDHITNRRNFVRAPIENGNKIGIFTETKTDLVSSSDTNEFNDNCFKIDEEKEGYNTKYSAAQYLSNNRCSSKCGNNGGFSNTDCEDEPSRDEDDLFGIAIVAEMKKISNIKKKMKLKANIYRLLYECSD
ncbi:hypothetical protein WA026_017038 [Henosepilachna vigintioctopunctata]|uniref:MADF domain-containing protein n=1 Tax=Henosepilachna vigintioctopunctata TaxID=420089 RepID=A0AAW1TUH2_9CUCU